MKNKKVKNNKPYSVKGKDYEEITPKWNDNLTFHIRSRKYKGQIKSEVFIKDKKRNEGRHYVNFISKSKTDYRRKIKGINENRGATIKGTNKGESYSLVGTEYNDISVSKYKVRHTETVSDKRKRLPQPKAKQQIWIHAEVIIIRQGRKKVGGPYTYYGYSRMGGTEKEAIDHIYGQTRTEHHLGSDDEIYIDRIIGKGFMSYDR